MLSIHPRDATDVPQRIGLSLTWLVSAAIIPLLLFGGGVAWMVIDQKQAAAEQQLARMAVTLRVAVDHELRQNFQSIELLASDAGLHHGEPAAFRQRAQAMLENMSDWRNAVLIDPVSHTVVASARPVANPDLPAPLQDEVTAAALAGKPRVAGVFAAGTMDTRPTVVMLAPVIRDNRVRHVLAIATSTAPFSEILAMQELPASWIGVIIDPRMIIAGRSRDPELHVGNPTTPTMIEKVSNNQQGLFSVITKEGVRSYAVVNRSPATGWSVGVGLPESEVDAPIRQTLRQIQGGGALMIALGILLSALIGRSIIRRRNAYESALRDSEARLQSSLDDFQDLVARIPLGVFKFVQKENGGQYFAFVSERFCEQLSVPSMAIYRDVNAAFDALHASDVTAFRAQLERFREPGKTFRWEVRTQFPKVFRWLLIEAEIIPLPNGDILWNGVQHDISERKLAEQTLLREVEKTRTLLRNASDGIHILDLDGNVVEASESFCRMLGYDHDEIIGMNVSRWDEALAGTDLRERMRSHHERHQIRQFEARHRRKDGSVFDVELTGQPVTLADKPVVFYSSRDITERKQRELELAHYRDHLEELVEQRTAALMATEARATHLLQSSADGLYGVDAQGHITFINPAACRMLGITAEEAIGHDAHTLFHHSRADGSPYPVEECPGHLAMKSGQGIRVDHEVYWHTDGHAIPVMYATHPMLQDGVNAGSVVSFVDMSEQRAAALAREQAVAAAENLARLRSEFVANMSHEIRTPLHGVLGFAQIGRRNAADAAKARNAFDKILTSGNLLLGIIDDILDFSKIEAGKIHIAPAQTPLRGLLDHAIDVVAERAAAKGLELRLETAPDLPATCVTDELRLSQILLNLLSNAVKFTEKGSVTLSAGCAGDALYFRIVDTGIGIAPEHLDKLFNPFEQADGSVTRKFGGTGLGLAICKRMAELMGGRIGVESKPGVGSTFELRLPLIVHSVTPAAAGAGPAAAPGAGNQPLAGLRILVADDNEINRLVLEDFLVEEGAHVTLADTGHAAVDGVVRDGIDAFDLVLMDLQMPDMNGYEATRLLQRLAPDLPIIAQTAHASAEERQQCLATGMVGYVTKPFDFDSLTALIREHALRRTSRTA